MGQYPEVVRAFHERGIAIEENVVFGMDADQNNVLEYTATFAIEDARRSILLGINTSVGVSPWWGMACTQSACGATPSMH